MDTATDAPKVLTRFKDTIQFSREWCEEFFNLSGDRNYLLHYPDGYGIVQGMALLTKVSSVVSERIPGFMLGEIEKVSIKHPVHLGETVTVELIITEGTKATKKIEIILTRDATEVLRGRFLLISQRVLSIKKS